MAAYKFIDAIGGDRVVELAGAVVADGTVAVRIEVAPAFRTRV